MKKNQKIEAIDALRCARSLIINLAAGDRSMTLFYYNQVLDQLEALQVIMMRETKE